MYWKDDEERNTKYITDIVLYCIVLYRYRIAIALLSHRYRIAIASLSLFLYIIKKLKIIKVRLIKRAKLGGKGVTTPYIRVELGLEHLNLLLENMTVGK